MATASKKKKTTTKDQDELEIKPVADPVADPVEDRGSSDEEKPKENEEDKKEEVMPPLEEEIEDKVEDTGDDKEEPTPEPDIDSKEEDKKEEEEIKPEVETDIETKEDEDIDDEDEDTDSTPTPMTPEIKFDQEPDADSKDDKTNKPKSNKGLFISLAMTLLVGGSLTGGILYSRSATTNQDIRSKAAETVESPSPTATPTAEATPTPEEINLSDYSFQIQNGSGTSGQAGVVDELLQAEGFSEAETTNADSYDYEDTEIMIKEGTSKSVYDAIERALNSDYNIVKGDVLDKDSDFDIVIIVGQAI